MALHGEKKKGGVLSVERVVIGSLGILIKNRLRGIVHKLRLIHSVQVFVPLVGRAGISGFNKFFYRRVFLHFYTGFEMIGRECIISLPLMESGEI